MASSSVQPILPLPHQPATAVAPLAAPAKPSLLQSPGLFSALVAVAGGILAVAGGGLKANAFNLLPREDGLFTAGVFVVVAAFGHGLRERWVYAVCAPILAISFYGILRFHHAPFALFGAELAVVGVIGLAFQRWRAWAREHLD